MKALFSKRLGSQKWGMAVVALRPRTLSLAAALCLAGAAPALAAPPPASAVSAPSGAREIARIRGEEPGNYVAWLETPEGEVDIAVAATFPSRPLVAGEFIKTRTPAEVFLALASPRAALPPALARGAEALRVNERQLREELRQENGEALARMALDPGEASASLVAGCTAGFRA